MGFVAGRKDHTLVLENTWIYLLPAWRLAMVYGLVRAVLPAGEACWEEDRGLAAAGNCLPFIAKRRLFPAEQRLGWPGPERLKQPERQGSGSRQAILRAPGRKGCILNRHSKQSLREGTGRYPRPVHLTDFWICWLTSATFEQGRGEVSNMMKILQVLWKPG